MFTGLNYFHDICAQEFFADVSDFGADYFTGNAMAKKHNLPIVARDAKATISYFVNT
jgi:hypothetical protein